MTTQTPAIDTPIHITGLQELASILVKHFGINEGRYQLAIGFRLGVGNVPGGPGDMQPLPGAVVGIENVSLVRVSDGVESPNVVDAAVVNPIASDRAPAKQKISPKVARKATIK